MPKTKRISVNTLERIEKETYTPCHAFDWNGVEIIVTRTLSLKEMLDFVNGAVKSCFMADNTYAPEIMDFAIKVSVLEKYANFTLPRNVESQYDMVYHTDAVDRVLEHVNYRQYQEICDSICAKVEHIAQANVSAINKQLNDVCASFNKLQEDISRVFSGIGSGEIKAMADAVSNGVLDEQKLVNAYIELTKGGTQ
jgi:hypothetical protein